jgi:hypothetical protein
MNLFILSLDPKKIAEYIMDKRVSKILLEAVQMLCSAKRLLDPEDEETGATVTSILTQNSINLI